MNIRIEYSFYTDGDYSLRNYSMFGCTDREVEIEDQYFNYIGIADFYNEEIWKCKNEAKNFLTQLLCDGIYISYAHYWLLESFYNIIESLIKFIDENDSGETCKGLSGNYEGTKISVDIQNYNFRLMEKGKV